ncbi:MAG: radical SAM protein [Deltaproteobacteria bacterium]|nr:radical SAM protein [Deltaproteobacteria bacterium]
MTKRNRKNLIIPVFLPFEGCQYRCIYCNQRLLHPLNKSINTETIKATVEEYLSTYRGERDKTDIEVAFYGGTFTGMGYEKQISLLKSLQEFTDNNRIDGIRFSTRPDKIDIELLGIYKRYKVKTIEIGAQSLRDEVLEKINRYHTATDTRNAVTLLKSHGFRTSVHLMFGLPGSSSEDDRFSVEETIKLAPEYVRLHPTLVLRDTELENLYKSGRYLPLSLNDAVNILRYAIRRFSESDIRVIRVGLHNDENLINPQTIVAGPFHPSIRQLI